MSGSHVDLSLEIVKVFKHDLLLMTRDHSSSRQSVQRGFTRARLSLRSQVTVPFEHLAKWVHLAGLQVSGRYGRVTQAVSVVCVVVVWDTSVTWANTVALSPTFARHQLNLFVRFQICVFDEQEMSRRSPGSRPAVTDGLTVTFITLT